jgi:peptidoglycan/LPS O-acetylase OafA/YrhL
MVLVFHITQMLGLQDSTIWRVARAGPAGVDLFFVLSGFLIGGLYWREHEEFGNVQRARFILRRACRTMPPYFVALAISWLAVRVARGEAFDPEYLVFLQNYKPHLPYFLVSWSLCIEEHFYLLLPIVLGLLCLSSARLSCVVLPFLALVPAILRFCEFQRGISNDFGYATTATHLRCDALILGVFAAYLFHYHRDGLQALVRLKVPIYAASALFVIVMPALPPPVGYTIGYTILAVLLTLCVTICAMDKPYRLSALKLTSCLAVTSYSIYLVHPLVIHACLRCFASLSSCPIVAQWVIMFATTVAIGGGFYWLIEKPAIRARDRLVARRASMARPVAPFSASTRSPRRDRKAAVYAGGDRSPIAEMRK